MRLTVLLVALSVVFTACGVSESDTSTTDVPISVVATSVPPTTTTVPPVDSTSLPPSSSTTTTLPSVTVDAHLPSALSRSEVPWDEVGFGWSVVLFDSSKAAPTGPGDVREGPVVLYLVSPTGERYEMAVWPPERRPWSLVDATSSAALVVGTGATIDDTAWWHVDFASGAVAEIHGAGFPENTFGSGRSASLTRPSGANGVVYRSDGVVEWLERRAPDGTLLATVYEQPYTDWATSLAWIYHYDGTSLLVGHSGGIALVSNTASVLGELWVPMDHHCEPVRWWDADTFLARCYGQGPGSAPLDEFGNPHTFYGRLWLLETDGSEGSPLTEYPPDPPIVVDFGYSDAWPAGTATLLQWTGDCGAAQIAELQSDGLGAFLPISVPPSIVADGVRMVDVNVVAGLITVYGWQGCAGDVGALFVTDLEGIFVQELVPVIGDARSVIGVMGLTEVYP